MKVLGQSPSSLLSPRCQSQAGSAPESLIAPPGPFTAGSAKANQQTGCAFGNVTQHGCRSQMNVLFTGPKSSLLSPGSTGKAPQQDLWGSVLVVAARPSVWHRTLSPKTGRNQQSGPACAEIRDMWAMVPRTPFGLEHSRSWSSCFFEFTLFHETFSALQDEEF